MDSCPLTVDNLSNPESLSPLTPNQMKMKAKPVLPPLVRSVKVVTGDPDISGTGNRVHPPSVLERPIQKLVLLLPREEKPGFPHGEPLNEDIQKKD